jgi:hypothetical protein
MVKENSIGGGLVLLALALLAGSGQLEWLALLLPISILAGCGLMWWGSKKTRLTHSLKKG